MNEYSKIIGLSVLLATKIIEEITFIHHTINIRNNDKNINKTVDLIFPNN